jgi:TonB family protein
MLMEYEGAGATTLYLSLDINGKPLLAVSNSGWSVKEKETYELRFVMDRHEYTGGTVIGLKFGLTPALATRMTESFVDEFAKSSDLTIYRGGTVVDDLSLKGSGSAVAVLRRCVASVKARLNAEARERARLAHIPADPFAPPTPVARAGSPPVQPEPARARGNPAGWITNEDYPAAALRAGEQGTARVQLAVGADGRVTGCSIIKSSGSATLDQTTCRIMERRAWYTPAKDTEGNAVASTTEVSFTWSLPAN